MHYDTLPTVHYHILLLQLIFQQLWIDFSDSVCNSTQTIFGNCNVGRLVCAWFLGELLLSMTWVVCLYVCPSLRTQITSSCKLQSCTFYIFSILFNLRGVQWNQDLGRFVCIKSVPTVTSDIESVTSVKRQFSKLQYKLLICIYAYIVTSDNSFCKYVCI